MKRAANVALCGLSILLGLSPSVVTVYAHDPRAYAKALGAPEGASAKSGPVPGISGQGKMRFRVLYTSEHLPEEARKVLVKAHGGFAVDRRPGRGETYFALPGAGILQISADLKSVQLLKTSDSMKNVNLHDTTIWYDPRDRSPYLVFPW
jgi:hypothetical protein